MRMGLVASDARFVRDTPRRLTLDVLRALARDVYAASHDNFTALHLVTGVQALGVVLARFPTLSERALRSFWVAMIAAWTTIDRPRADRLPDG